MAGTNELEMDHVVFEHSLGYLAKETDAKQYYSARAQDGPQDMGRN